MRYYILILLFVSGCAPMQYNSGQFRGMGEYSNPYQDSSSYAENQPHYREYQPEAPFALSWPVSRIKISQTYRPRSNPRHEGLDLTGSYKAPILSAHEGYVVYTGSQYRGYGRIVIIEYDKTWATLYGHLEDIYVKEGNVVKPGHKIGAMGNTGRTSGIHLHFELLQNKQPVDPLPFLRSHNKMARQFY